MSGGVVDRANAGFEEDRIEDDQRDPLTADEEGEMIALRSWAPRTKGQEARFQQLKRRWVLWNDAADYAQCECCATSYEQGHSDGWMQGYQEGYTQGVKERS